jgi:hypothetical protein
MGSGHSLWPHTTAALRPWLAFQGAPLSLKCRRSLKCGGSCSDACASGRLISKQHLFERRYYQGQSVGWRSSRGVTGGDVGAWEEKLQIGAEADQPGAMIV